jgi:hypothetical protein
MLLSKYPYNHRVKRPYRIMHFYTIYGNLPSATIALMYTNRLSVSLVPDRD